MSITIEKAASDKLKEILESKSMNASTIRVFMSGMGCSGAMFNLAADEEKEGDVVSDFEGMKYVVEKNLVDQFDGFDIVLVDQGDAVGLYVQPKNPGEVEGCASCSGCN